MEDAGEAGIEAGMGFGRGFVHPLDTLSETAGHIVGLGHDLFRGDFSKISNVTGRGGLLDCQGDPWIGCGWHTYSHQYVRTRLCKEFMRKDC